MVLLLPVEAPQFYLCKCRVDFFTLNKTVWLKKQKQKEQNQKNNPK